MVGRFISPTDQDHLATARNDFSKLRNRLDELELQLKNEEESNRVLRQDLRRTEQTCEQLKREIEQLKKQLSINNEPTFATTDEEIIKLKAIHNAQIRAKEKEIAALRQELEAVKTPLTESDLYTKVAVLKEEIKKKNAEINAYQQQMNQERTLNK